MKPSSFSLPSVLGLLSKPLLLVIEEVRSRAETEKRCAGWKLGP